MPKSWILMTAMPPTKGHLNLIRFGAALANETHVIVCTQPGEPFAFERFEAVKEEAANIHTSRVIVHHLHRELPQDPESEGFWALWQKIMLTGTPEMTRWYYGVEPGDYIVSSEPYGQTLADLTGAVFMPYDPDRELYYTKATNIRNKLGDYFHDIMPAFQRHLRSNIVIFGAESTGKTTLSRELSYHLNAHWFFEWARPYLETVGPEITKESMTAIWHGQEAIQAHAHDMVDKPYAIFDTDLYSTVGYWEQPHWESELGAVPEDLIYDAALHKADLYIILQSNIPFEEDPIRYGGDRRESPDDYWIALAEKYDLNYVVLPESEFTPRLGHCIELAKAQLKAKAESIFYDRGGF